MYKRQNDRLAIKKTEKQDTLFIPRWDKKMTNIVS